MSDDTQVRDFLERMAGEIDVVPLDPRGPVKRARRHRSVATALLVLVVAALVVAGSIGVRSFTQSQPAVPQPGPMHNGPIDVWGYMDGVRTLTPKGAGPYVYTCPQHCFDPVGAWSPDGTRLVFTTGCSAPCSSASDPYNGLHVVDVGSGTDRLVVPGDSLSSPAWSPDGSRIAYAGGDPSRIFVMNADGSAPIAIGVNGGEAQHLSWSPDGSRIAYEIAGQLFVTGVAPGSSSSRVGSGSYPAWSPDGSTIAYFSMPGCEIRQMAPDGHRDVSLIDLGTVAHRCSYGGDLTWSPDGTALSAFLWQEITARHYFGAVYLVEADGNDARPFTDWIEDPQWYVLSWRPIP